MGRCNNFHFRIERELALIDPAKAKDTLQGKRLSPRFGPGGFIAQMVAPI